MEINNKLNPAQSIVNSRTLDSAGYAHPSSVGACTATEAQLPEIPTAIRELFHAVSELEDNYSALVQKLEEVTFVSGEVQPAVQERMGQSTRIGADIFEATRRIDQVCENLRVLRRSVRL